MTYQNIFPLRAIDYMPFLKSKYEQLVASSNEATNTANKILLHSEGDGHPTISPHRRHAGVPTGRKADR